MPCLQKPSCVRMSGLFAWWVHHMPHPFDEAFRHAFRVWTSGSFATVIHERAKKKALLVLKQTIVCSEPPSCITPVSMIIYARFASSFNLLCIYPSLVKCHLFLTLSLKTFWFFYLFLRVQDDSPVPGDPRYMYANKVYSAMPWPSGNLPCMVVFMCMFRVVSRRTQGLFRPLHFADIQLTLFFVCACECDGSGTPECVTHHVRIRAASLRHSSALAWVPLLEISTHTQWAIKSTLHKTCRKLSESMPSQQECMQAKAHVAVQPPQYAWQPQNDQIMESFFSASAERLPPVVEKIIIHFLCNPANLARSGTRSQ